MSTLKNNKLTLDQRALITPQQLRSAIREGQWSPDETSTQYYCRGYTQLNLVVIPKDMAFEFLTFCVRNPRYLIFKSNMFFSFF